MEEGQKEMLEQIERLRLVTTGNPCGMPDYVFKAMASAIKALMSRDFETSLNIERTARLLNVSIRTLHRWKKDREFPKGKRVGRNPLSFSIDEISEWMSRNKTQKRVRKIHETSSVIPE